MKSKEELNAIKEEVETVSRKLRELTDEELEQVTGRLQYDWRDYVQGNDGVFFIGRHNIREPLVGSIKIPDPSDEQIIK